MGSVVTTSVNIPWYNEMVKHGLKPINANKKNTVSNRQREIKLIK